LKRSLVAVLAAALGAAGCNRVDVRGPARPDGPSVLLVTIDTLRADHVGAYGDADAETPRLDALAVEGALFETAIASTPLTLPSHTSILTGKHPPHHAVRHNGIFLLDASHVTLAERFREAGFATAAVVGAAVLEGHYGIAQGFEHYDDRAFDHAASATGYPERRAGQVTDAALAWLATAPTPFFLWVHYYDPHGAYRPPPPFAERFAARPYDGEIAYVDRELGRLLDGIAAERLARTVVAVTSDHGESLGEHGEATHAYTLHDAALRVPWLLRGPGVPAGRRVAGVVSSVDVAPTLLALAGLPPLPDADGRDLTPRLAGAPAPPGAAVYAETLATLLDHGWAPLFAARSDAHLYVRAPRAELYDVASDPTQTHDLAASQPEAAAARVPELEAVLSGVLAAEREGRRVALDARARAVLAALGYLVDDAATPPNGMDPKDGLPLLREFIAAEGLYNYRRLDEAERRGVELLAKLPDSPRLLNLLARIELTQGMPQRALPHAERAVTLVPRSAQHREMLGTVRLAAGDVAGAVADFEAAEALDPGDPETQAGLMWKIALGGDLEEAARHAAAALGARPLDTELALRVADGWDRLGQFDRALAVYRDIVHRHPEEPRGRTGLALQLVRFGAQAEADVHLAAAGDAARAPAFELRLAVALAARGERARAAALLRDLVARHPTWPAPRQVLARVEAELR
jgi:arylsulfatase A-like enzyme/Flp pilus assembly protein TadD